MTTLHLPIRRTSAVPLHRQIYQGLRHAILEGRLRPGQRVPSTRALAADLQVSRLPVLTAFDQLLHEGYLEGRTGSGTYVSHGVPDTLLRPPSLSPATSSSGVRRKPLAPVNDDYAGGARSFRMSLPALDHFPHALWDRTVARHVHRLSPAEMDYGDPAGLPALRRAIAEHLRTARAVRCEAEQVLIVSGSQMALRVAAMALFQRGDRVAVEEPGYPGARAALQTGGVELLPVPVDGEGMSIAALTRRGARVRAAYVTPSHQYPLGTSMTATRRFALLDWAAERKAWILEDDYDSEYRYVSRPLGALQGMDADERVIYIGTFSKVLFPAIRVGYVVVPPSIWDRFVAARAAIDLFAPTLYQAALAEFLDRGHFGRHLRRMRGVYLQRRNALLTGLEQHCGDLVRVHNADAGLHLVVLLRDGLEDARVVERLAARGLRATALSSCYSGGKRECGLLLGFGGTTERQLLDATRVLGEILRGAS